MSRRGKLARRYGHSAVSKVTGAVKRVGATAKSFADKNAPLVAATVGGAVGGLVAAAPGAVIGAAGGVAIEEAARKR